MQHYAAGRAKYTQKELRDMIARYVPLERAPKHVRLITDTSDFFRVDYGDIVILEDIPMLVRNYEREGRFGIDDEPKFWVRRALDLTTGDTKIIKMAFLENFRTKVGDIIFECVRNPKKEARILDLVRGHPNFMQGYGTQDSKGNVIRVIDYIHGKTMADRILQLGSSHEDYFYHHFPAVLNEFIDLLKAIGYLHKYGEKHGDIRRDHILRDDKTQTYRWIDFDFNFMHRENMFGYDLFGLGNILVYLAGRGDVTVQDLSKNNRPVFVRLNEEDLNIIFNHRVVNLRKVYPYIPERLNRVLLHFSTGANIFYDDTSQLADDLKEVAEKLQYTSTH